MGDIWVSDIDGTISDGGDPIGNVVRHLQRIAENDGDVYIVSARSTDDLESTRRWLEDNNVPFDELILNPDGGDATAYKVRVAERLIADDHVIQEWIENNPDTRRALDALGVNAIGPSSVRSGARRHLMGEKMETRTITVDDIEVREAGDGMTFSGYAAVFNSPSEPLPFTETIAPGAFRRSLSSRNNVLMLLNHDPAVPLASTRSKTLSLAEDGTGLRAQAKLPDTSAGRDLSVLLRDGIVNSMSFGFSVPKGGDSWSDDGMTRTLRSVRLHEVSVVAFPAYAATSASVRSLDALATRTGLDADALADAITSLEGGTELTRDQAQLLDAVITKLAPAEEPEPAVEVPSLALLRDQLDLALKAI